MHVYDRHSCRLMHSSKLSRNAIWDRWRTRKHRSHVIFLSYSPVAGSVVPWHHFRQNLKSSASLCQPHLPLLCWLLGIPMMISSCPKLAQTSRIKRTGKELKFSNYAVDSPEYSVHFTFSPQNSTWIHDFHNCTTNNFNESTLSTSIKNHVRQPVLRT